MRQLNAFEIHLVSGGARATPKDETIIRAEPATDVNGDHPGNATGWCRGFGNLKPGEMKHEHADCGGLPPPV